MLRGTVNDGWPNWRGLSSAPGRIHSGRWHLAELLYDSGQVLTLSADGQPGNARRALQSQGVTVSRMAASPPSNGVAGWTSEAAGGRGTVAIQEPVSGSSSRSGCPAGS